MPWLADLLPEVDVSERRQILLADPRSEDSVPQARFKTHQIMRLPPCGQFLLTEDERHAPDSASDKFKHLLRFLPLYMKRLSSESCDDCPGLKTTAWRSVLKGKYIRTCPPLPVPSTLLPSPSTPLPSPSLTRPMLPLPAAAAPTSSTAGENSMTGPFDMDLDQDGGEQRYDERSSWPQTATFLRQHYPNEAPPRKEPQRYLAEPDRWHSTEHDHYFESVEGHMIREGKEARGARGLGWEIHWDIWFDYDNNRVLYFRGYLDGRRPAGERYISANFFSRNHRNLGPKSKSTRCWPFRKTKAPTPRGITKSAKATPPSGEALVRSPRLLPSTPAPPPQTKPDAQLPPKDPLYGWYPFPPESPLYWNGKHVDDSKFADSRFRQSVLAFLTEMTLRFDILELDCIISQSQSVVRSHSETMLRSSDICSCRGPDETLLPHPGAPIPANNPTWQARRAQTYAFASLMQIWPRFPDRLLSFNKERHTEHEFRMFERRVWRFYAQTFFDYFRRYPTLPCLAPLE